MGSASWSTPSGWRAKGDLSDAEFNEHHRLVASRLGRPQRETRCGRCGTARSRPRPRDPVPEGWKLVRAHQKRGHTVAIASSATLYQIEPLAAEYGIERIVRTRARVRNG